jgi:hypothetical protein
MLTDELSRLEAPAAMQAAGAFRDACSCVREAWAAAVFSTAGEAELRRYFSFHLKGIAQMAQRVSSEATQGELLNLVTHIAFYYPESFDHDAPAPCCYSKKMLDELCDLQVIFCKALEKVPLPSDLSGLLLDYNGMVNNAAIHTFRTLNYYRLFLEKLAVPDLTETVIREALLEINFNHLGYFAWLRQSFESEGNYRQLLARYAGQPVGKEHIYHPAWPSINEMICGWLREAIKLEKAPVEAAPPVKLPLELSVSHLAFMTRLFVDEKLYGATPLTDIFKFLARNYTTKRQATISPGSLSKEFYSTDQQAAARVRGILQNMVARINRNYFPVTVVASAITFLWLKNY